MKLSVQVMVLYIYLDKQVLFKQDHMQKCVDLEWSSVHLNINVRKYIVRYRNAYLQFP